MFNDSLMPHVVHVVYLSIFVRKTDISEGKQHLLLE